MSEQTRYTGRTAKLLPKFKVTLHRVQASSAHPNPFLIHDIWSLPPVRMLCRSWEIEARNEKHVRELLEQAMKADHPEMRGFRLRSIELLTDAQQARA